MGLCTVVVLVSYVLYELSYDKSYSNATQLYRIQALNTQTGQEKINLPMGLGDMFVEELPEVTQSTPLRQMQSQFKVGENFYKENVLVTEPAFFKMFSLSFLIGNPAKALADENTVVISESFAKKIFPKLNAVNQTIHFQGYNEPSLIVGVFKDLPSASHLDAKILVRAQLHQRLNWKSYSAMPQYVQLAPGAKIKDIDTKIKSLYKKYSFPKEIQIKLLPITKIHLYSKVSDEMSPNGNISYIYIFSIVALLILLIAIVNFINLTIASSLKRGKEIGVKKVMGASSSQLRLQFLSESYIYIIIATVFVLILAHDLVPLLSNKLGISISLNEMISSKTIGVSIAIILISGFIAGVYPAIILSRLMPVKTLKGYVVEQGGKFGFKRLLMVFQFSISAFLIVCTLIINSQLQFIRNKNLGFQSDQLLVSSFNMFRNGYANFKEEALKNPAIKSISMSTFSPGESFGSSSSWTNDKDTTLYQLDFIHADMNFLNTLDISVVKGRAFSPKIASDYFDYDNIPAGASEEEREKIISQAPIILNEAAVKMLNLKNSVDTNLLLSGLQGKVIGVVKDFNGMSLHNQVRPLAIKYEPKSNYGYMYIRVNGENLGKVRSEIDEIWKRTLPENPPDFQFVDEHLETLYAAEMRLGNIFFTFSGIAIFLCIIGLFGMVYFDLEQRTKEIALRKILGATVKDLLSMLNGTFIKTVFLANLIIWPFAYYLTEEWLKTFYYRTTIDYQPFVIALIICLLLTVLTVTFQAIKVVRKSPVDALKYE